MWRSTFSVGRVAASAQQPRAGLASQPPRSAGGPSRDETARLGRPSMPHAPEQPNLMKLRRREFSLVGAKFRRVPC